MKKQMRMLIVVVLFVLVVSSAQATSIKLSNHSSKATVAPDLLAAELGFTSVTLDKAKENRDTKKWLITHTVANLTDPVFAIDQIFFNLDLDPALINKIKVKDFDLGDKNNWVITYDPDNIGGNGEFGQFDISLTSTSELIGSGETGTFLLEIETTFAAILTEDSFIALSVSPSDLGQPLAYGVAKFKNGPDGASAYGAYVYVPEPVTICLLALGGLMLRKRRSN